MAAIQVASDSSLAKSIQNAIQPQIVANGWVSEESDMTLAEYITMMLVNGQNEASLVNELGQDLLGADPDDKRPAEFGKYLFEQARSLQAAEQQAQAPAQPSNMPSASNEQDTQMNVDSAPTDNAPTGPKSMRNGTSQRGRGGRMLGQMNRQMDRAQDPSDSLRRIKGAAGGQSGRINTHARDGTPRGPRGATSGVQRMANGRGNFGNLGGLNMMQNAPIGGMGPSQQMQFMQMMEMQSQMLATIMQNGGSIPGANGHSPRGGIRGGRGGAAKRPQQLHAVNGKLPDAPLQSNTGSAMEVDGVERKDMFSTRCKFDLGCTNAACGFFHQSPAAPAGTPVDASDTCPHGVACMNAKCSSRHPSPAQRNGQNKKEVDCKFYPNCTNIRCPFRHPSEMPLCRNGADCTVPNCKFTHSKIACRYNPCLNPNCAFKHTEGQRGKFADKVWTADGSNGNGEQQNGKPGRFEAFAHQTADGEELILPDKMNGEGVDETVMQDSTQGNASADADIVT